MKSNISVGIFDSGCGGLSVAKRIYEAKIFPQIIYYADNLNAPYGKKSKEVIRKCFLDAMQFLKSQDIKLLIVACNTACIYALEEAQENFSFPIIGMLECISKTLDNYSLDKESKILLLATQATLKSQQYQNTLQSLGYKHVHSLAPSLLIPLIEEGIVKGNLVQACLKHYFENLHFLPDAVILGCTHFPLIHEELQNFFGEKTLLLDPAENILEVLNNYPHLIKNTKSNTNTRILFHASNDTKVLSLLSKTYIKESSA